MRCKPLFFVCATAALAACQTPEALNIRSDFRSPGADGLIEADLKLGGFSGTSRKVEEADGDGFAYAVGAREDGGFAGYAGLLDSTSVAASPGSGSATFDARYRLLEVSDINVSSTFVTGSTDAVSGDITLRADFDAGSLRGDSSDGLLRVRGTLSDRNSVGGAVTFRGVDGDLRGMVSDREVVGAFHGHDDETIFAGGFTGDAR